MGKRAWVNQPRPYHQFHRPNPKRELKRMKADQQDPRHGPVRVIPPDVGGTKVTACFGPNTVTIHTDGACRTHGDRAGGWGVVLVSGKYRLELSGSEPATTNNRMELLAVIRGLEALTWPSTVVVVSDSKYVVGGHGWAPGWRRHGWRLRSGHGPVKNVDLWERLLALTAQHEVTFRWVRGHDGDAENERADQLARGAVG